MFVEFWSNLQTHDWRFLNNDFAKHALLVYQGQQRKKWHLTIGMAGGYSLAQINQDLLVKTQDNLQSQAFNKELARLSKVSASISNDLNGSTHPPSSHRAHQPSGHKHVAPSDTEEQEGGKKWFCSDQSALPARSLSHGMGSSTLSQSVSTSSCMPRSPTNKYVPTGKESTVLSSIPPSTYAQGAGLTPTQHSVALMLRNHQTQTPYIAEAWECELHQAGIMDRFHKIPPGIRHGFMVDFL
ncbi:hypothetical protein APHAL10511_005704 [Amanita phalloides]|nr:hypothetical protein APHAL10511_005704 [Amanita phalloides]